MEEKKIPLITKKGITDINNDNKISISNISICTEESTSDLKLCETPFIYQKEKYLVDKEKNEIISLYSTFKYLKEKYDIDNKRKNRMDCIIKKVKTKFLNAIHEVIKFCVNLKINKLPQYFITNIKIEFNKTYLYKTLEEIYTEFNIIPPLKELIDKNIIKKRTKELFIKLMNSSLKDIYQCYLSSEFYKYYKIDIIKKEGENFAKIYDYVAKNICKYFIYNKGNKKDNYIDNDFIRVNYNNNNNNFMYEKKISNNKIDFIKQDVNKKNNFSTYKTKNNEFVSLYKNKIKFNVFKYE